MKNCKGCVYEHILAHSTPCGRCISGSHFMLRADLPHPIKYRATKDITEAQKKEIIKKLNTWYVNVGKATELTEEIFRILDIKEI